MDTSITNCTVNNYQQYIGLFVVMCVVGVASGKAAEAAMQAARTSGKSAHFMYLCPGHTARLNEVASIGT